MVKQVFVIRVGRRFVSWNRFQGSIQVAPTFHSFLPIGRDFGKHIDSSANVLAAFCVVGGGGQQGMRPFYGALFIRLVEPVNRGSKGPWIATYFVQGTKAEVAIEGGVLQPFCHDRAGQLLKLQDKLPCVAPALF